MKLDAPEIDKRKSEDVFKRLRELIPFYTPGLNADLDRGAGIALLKIFSNMTDAIIQRLNRTPLKNFIAFLDMLGVKLLPPQPATAPVTFVLSEGAKENVLVPERSQAAAGEIIFETEKTFVATPSKLVKAYSVSDDGIYEAPSNIITGKKPSPFSSKLLYSAKEGEKEIFLESTAGLEKGDILKLSSTEEYAVMSDIADAKITLTDKLKEGHIGGAPVKKVTEFELFKGKDLQEHILYLGHGDLFNIKEMATITIKVFPEAALKLTSTDFIWEYWGEAITISGQTEINDTGWHLLETKPMGNGSKEFQLIKKLPGQIMELEFNGLTNRWIRCKPKSPMASDLILDGILFSSEGSHLVSKFYDLAPAAVRGVGEKFNNRLVKGNINRIELLLAFKNDVNELAKRLMPEGNVAKKSFEYYREQAENILENAEKRILDEGYEGGEFVYRSAQGIFPDIVFYNDIPLNPSLLMHPFGKTPRLHDSFYIASQEAFSKKGEKITLKITGIVDSSGDPPPEPLLSWEYWDGNGWINIPDIQEDFMFTTTTVTRTLKIDNFPELKSTKVNGKENLWIRVRLIGGHYGREIIVEGKEVKQGTVAPPIIISIAIEYTSGPQYPQHCLSYNNLEFRNVTDECKTGKPFKPFEPLDVAHKALYLGFDKKLEKGPINVFFDVKEPEALKEGARLVWEYFAAVDGTFQWLRLEVLDSTNAFNNSGTVEFVLPDNFIKSESFGKERYWIRAVDVEDKTGAPVLKGIYVNTAWAVQAESVKDELLGSSGGEARQAFSVSRFPVLSSEVWVDEINALSDGERKRISEEKYPQSREVKDDKGNTVEFRIKWTAVDDLLASSKNDRHYEMDGSSGRILFGDGKHGMVPTIGKDNIRTGYRTGGGVKGNVGAFEISALKTSIAFVDKVNNPIPSGGGAELELIGSALDRGSRCLRNRRRCITEEDYEDLAKEASRSIARAKCIPNGNREFETGCVSVVIIPSSSDDKPVPSLQLKTQTANYLREHAAGVVAASDNLFVTGPLYLKISVDAEIVASAMEDVPLIEKAAYSELKKFLHPLTGGYEGRGWDFGRLPFYSDFYSLLEKIKGVDHVKELVVMIEDTVSKKNRTLAIEPPEETTCRIHMICSGLHEITVNSGRIQ